MADRNNYMPPEHPHPSYSPTEQQSQPARSAALWSNSNPPLPRGRAPKDPNARSAKFNCSSIPEMEANLRNYLSQPPASPEHSSCELTLWSGASLDSPEDTADAAQLNGSVYQPRNVMEALTPTVDPKDNMKKQRAVSKICVAAVQRVDGFRYSFHNNWKSGEENAFRFSYYCNDSLLNKDRVANGKAGSQGRRATKPVYDCRGVLSIKFSATRGCIDVIYRHVPCHPTYEERAPPPRRESKRRASWERVNHDRVRKSVSRPEGELAEPTPKRPKKIELTPKASVESELRQSTMTSLLDLMRANEAEANHSSEVGGQPNGAEVARPSIPEPPTNVVTTPPEPPAVISICETCLHRRSRCDGAKPKCSACANKNWPCWYGKPAPPRSKAPTEGPAAAATIQLAKEKKLMQKERDQAHQLLKNSQDEIESLRNTVKNQAKDYEERFKRLEAKLQEKPNPPPPPIPQQSNNISQPQTSSAYQPHQMNQPTRLNPNPAYNPHSTDRISHGQPYPSQMATAPSSKPHSFSQPSQALPISDHNGRGPIYHGQNQQMVPSRWPSNPQQFMYQQTPDSSNLWNTPHMPSQLR